jgi:hypothetical protein
MLPSVNAVVAEAPDAAGSTAGVTTVLGWTPDASGGLAGVSGAVEAQAVSSVENTTAHACAPGQHRSSGELKAIGGNRALAHMWNRSAL